MRIGRGTGRMTSMVFNTFSLSKQGEEFLKSPSCVELLLVTDTNPPTCSAGSDLTAPSTSTAVNSSGKAKQSRSTKGMHLLPILHKLLATRTFWYDITSNSDHHFPGVFEAEFPQRLGHCSDITNLSSYTSSDEHFLLDIQLGKLKPRTARKITFDVDGTQEELWYRIAPCAGVKVCKSGGCSFVTSTRELKCPSHPDQPLCNVGRDCSVEFVYVWPTDSDDNRRWLSGLTRTGNLQGANLHDHPLHQASKIPSKIIHDIRQKVVDEPTIKTHDIITGNCNRIYVSTTLRSFHKVQLYTEYAEPLYFFMYLIRGYSHSTYTGKGMPYMPAAASLAAAHKGKIGNIRMAALRETKEDRSAGVVIMNFEKQSVVYDRQQVSKTGAAGKFCVSQFLYRIVSVLQTKKQY